jgi:hypothetical protein
MVDIVVYDAGTIADLRRMDAKIEAAAMKALGYLGVAYQAEAQANANGPFNSGGPHIPWDKPGPNKRSGNLIRSIRPTLPIRKGFGSYSVSVGPSMVYAMAVELGHPKWKSGVNYPYMKPAYDAMLPKAKRIFTNSYKRFRGI